MGKNVQAVLRDAGARRELLEKLTSRSASRTGEINLKVGKESVSVVVTPAKKLGTRLVRATKK